MPSASDGAGARLFAHIRSARLTRAILIPVVLLYLTACASDSPVTTPGDLMAVDVAGTAQGVWAEEGVTE